MRVQFLTSDISACHQLPARRDERAKPMIVSFLNNAVKQDVMCNLKRTKMYVKELLTQKNAALFKKARDLGRHRYIDTTWTYNGKVFLKSPNLRRPQETVDVVKLPK